MTVRRLYASIPGVTGIESINLTGGYNQSFSICTIVADDATVDLNDTITVDMGYEDEHQQVFSGRIKEVRRSRAEGTLTLVAKDILIDAAEFFMVAFNPDDPWSRNNILAEDLVGDLLAEAGITGYSPSVPLSFTFGINAPATFNLISVMDAVNQVATILAWHVYCDTGIVYFRDVVPYWRSGSAKDTQYGQSGNLDDPLDYIFCTDGSIIPSDFPGDTIYDTVIQMERSYSDENLRNRVVVIGRDGIVSDAHVTSPYLPPDFYKTAVIASPLIDSGTMADAAAQYNLSLLNRLTDSMTLDILGNPAIKPRQFCVVGDNFIGVDKNDYWFIYEVNHTWGGGGYTTKLILSR